MDPADTGTDPLTQDNPPAEVGETTDPAVAQSNEEAGTTPEAPDYGNLLGDENFNPDSLPEELRPAYNQLRADYTRKTQALAQQRDEAAQALEFVASLNSESDRAAALAQIAEAFGPEAILEALGYELDDEGVGSGAPAPEQQTPASDPRLDQLWERLNAEDEARSEAELIAQIEAYADNEFTRLGISDDDVKELVLGRAAVYDLDDQGLPQIEAAAKDVARLLSKQKADIFTQKAQTPAPPVPGTAGEVDDVDFSDPDARQAYMASLLESPTT